MNEKLSALMDGELSEIEERRALDEMSKDARLRTSWERYHLIRAAITRQLEIVVRPGLTDRIYSGLEDPVVQARPPVHRRLMAGAALAASVAAVALYGIQSLQSPLSPPLPTPLAANQVTSPERPEGRLNAYLVGHNEVMPIAGMGGMLPYVRVVTYDRDK